MTAAASARAFPAFAPRAAHGVAGRTWWGRAWTEALEHAALDGRLLRKGRACAVSGRVGPITIAPGRITARVCDADGTSYRTDVRIEPLDDARWERLLDQVAAEAGHLAALLERELSRELVAAAADADVSLLPGMDELDHECDCPDWELPCLHGAALGYQTAWLLDADPFVLLLMRGRDEPAVLERLRARRPRPAAKPGDAAGIEARAAYRALVALPADPPPVREPAAPLRVAPAPGIPAGELERLAAAAAQRARELLAEPNESTVRNPPAEEITR
ncbi:hypothetical protein B4N89_29955 [Embleya scabrispora]|uniref:SWIM-type domain-containing protein n=1 Tax=Embleya scabrispora TaxID=159449 RepID=A0A1T3P655_9ACTN|nr:hypothetical protein [Embleya scabrispora]OPC84587.1 hypothetical protein B4N89_29955 [Embleya scabrispora]